MFLVGGSVQMDQVNTSESVLFFLLFPTRKKSHVHCFERWHRFSSVCPFR